MILLDASSEETALTKEIKDMGAEPSINNWLKDNVDKFILSFSVLEKANNISSQEEEDALRSKIEEKKICHLLKKHSLNTLPLCITNWK